jgi:ribosomal protein S3
MSVQVTVPGDRMKNLIGKKGNTIKRLSEQVCIVASVVDWT